MTELTVSVARPGDVAALVESMTGLSREDAGQHDPYRDPEWVTREGGAYYAGLVGEPAVLLLLAREGERVLGHLVGKLSEPTSMRPCRFAILESMRVAPESRGRGVGGRLVEEFFGWAREHHAEQAVVTAYAANQGALRFYARHGFAPHEVSMRATV
jgi:GNAT superfamily N-acetyltransferase